MSEDLYWALIDIVNSILTGAMLGGSYALISVGLALTFGVMKLVNLSHGDWLILAAYLCAAVLPITAGVSVLTLIVVVPVMFGLGYALQRLLLNHITAQSAEARGLSPLQAMMLPLLVTFGLSITLSQVMLNVFSADAETIPNGLSFSSFRLTEDLSVSTLRFCFFIAAGIITAALAFWLNRTHTGRSLRAASDDPETAALMGMRTPHVYAVASGLSLAVASVAGFMIGMSRSFQPFDGPPYLLIAFGVVVIGGIGSLSGVFLGGITLGIVQVFAGTFFGPAAQQIAGYIFILAVLALRPNGIFSRAR